jgi:uncharacterized protein (DUF2132 family)
LQTTELFFRKELAKKEIIELIQHNLSHLINYSKIVNDLDYYLWNKMADAKDVILCFNNDVEREGWINLIKKDLLKFGEEEDFPLYLLKLFEKIHWIEIENDKDLIFHIRLSKMRYQNEIEFLINTLSKYSSVEKANGKHYLKKKEF